MAPPTQSHGATVTDTPSAPWGPGPGAAAEATLHGTPAAAAPALRLEHAEHAAAHPPQNARLRQKAPHWPHPHNIPSTLDLFFMLPRSSRPGITGLHGHGPPWQMGIILKLILINLALILIFNFLF